MIIKQISVFVENGVGEIAEITDILTANQINIRSLYVADASEFGILRMIVDDANKAKKVLQDKGIAVKETDVIAAEMPDRPGALGDIVRVLTAEGVNIEYMYAFIGKSEGALMVFKADQAQKAEAALENSGVVDVSATNVFDSLK